MEKIDTRKLPREVLEGKHRMAMRLLHDTPLQHGIERALWTREAVRTLIARLCGVALPMRTVGLYLQRRCGRRPCSARSSL